MKPLNHDEEFRKICAEQLREEKRQLVIDRIKDSMRKEVERATSAY